jgi:hypothetical protein
MGTLFTGALLGSIVTLLLKWFVGLISDGLKHEREKCLVVFQEKLQVDKTAMAWLQEDLDAFIILQSALRTCDTKPNPVNYQNFIHAFEVSCSLMKSKKEKLNPIYTFQSFEDLEKKYNALDAARVINNCYAVMGKVNLQYQELVAAGVPDSELAPFKEQFITACRLTADAIDNQIGFIAEIQNRIRTGYQKYLK